MVVGDKSRVMQVVLGIVSNAIKFTQTGEVKIEVEKVLDEEKEFLKVSVIDTGLGIPYEHQDKLFKLFGFMDQNSVNKNGVGLGLVITRDICNAYGGDITFTSVPKEGSKFYITFEIT